MEKEFEDHITPEQAALIEKCHRAALETLKDLKPFDALHIALNASYYTILSIIEAGGFRDKNDATKSPSDLAVELMTNLPKIINGDD